MLRHGYLIYKHLLVVAIVALAETSERHSRDMAPQGASGRYRSLPSLFADS